MAEQNLTLQILQTIVGFLGICGNGLVCVVIIKVNFMHTVTNAFIFNQALIDFLGSLLILLGSLTPIPDPIPPGIGGVLLCTIWISKYFTWALFITSTFNLVALTLERYLAIVFPFRYQVVSTRRNVLATVLGVWIFGCLFVTYNIFLRYYEDGKCLQKLVKYTVVLGVAVVVLTYILPVIVMLLAYVHITVVLKKGADRVGPAPAVAIVARGNVAAEGQGESLMRARRNTFKTLLIVFVTFIVCWTPNVVIFFLSNMGFVVDFKSTIYNITIVMVASNSCVNPLIYAIKYKQFRKAIKTVFRRSDAIVNDSPLPSLSNGHG